MRLSAVVAVSGLCSVLLGCDSVEIGGQKATLKYTDDAQASYNQALDAFRKKEWVDAKALFTEVKKLFAYSRYARLAELRLADIEFETEKYADSVSAYRDFLQSHRNDPEIEYARYKITVGLFKDVDDTLFLPPQEERDQSTALEAYKEIRAFIRDFPKTRFHKEEAYMQEVIIGRLVRHELYVARYYLRRDDFIATVARVNYALKTFPGSSLEPEALVLKGETLLKMKKIPEAQAVFETVTTSYDGPFTHTAKSFLDEIQVLKSRPLRVRPEDEPAK